MSPFQRKPKQFLCATDYLYCTMCHVPLTERQNSPHPSIPNVPLCKECHGEVVIWREQERNGNGNLGVKYVRVPIEVKFYPKRPVGRPSASDPAPDLTDVEFTKPMTPLEPEPAEEDE